MTTREAADRAGVSLQAVAKWRRRFPSLTIGHDGGAFILDADIVDQIIAARGIFGRLSGGRA
ncbi:hypothetical protein [Aliihoeflea sp. 40Bstr573]|uniref:hypothetical protein n=1 Tax=Aliihoeflea sp. 40Bstr573 TaxID=2696467 RepID=UPI0020949CBF|nr:hypothetical protein [Aliihoeflea sp. 40Bstr573]MCO6389392.1 hypothetical protein [Aliihoeflea sp. 40Bstr573]